MNIDDKMRLARVGDMSRKACAIRLQAARLYTGMQQQDFASAIGIKKTTFNNMETVLAFPSHQVMKYLYRAHRVDFNFSLFGEFAQLPLDVQDGLFVALPNAEREWDRRESLGSARNIDKNALQRS